MESLLVLGKHVAGSRTTSLRSPPTAPLANAGRAGRHAPGREYGRKPACCPRDARRAALAGWRYLACFGSAIGSKAWAVANKSLILRDGCLARQRFAASETLKSE
jgi:hypothetical protein